MEIGIFSMIINVNLTHLLDKDVKDFIRLHNQLK